MDSGQSDDLLSSHGMDWTMQNLQVWRVHIQHLFYVCLLLPFIDCIFLSKQWVRCKTDNALFQSRDFYFNPIILCNIQRNKWMLVTSQNAILLSTIVQWASCVPNLVVGSSGTSTKVCVCCKIILFKPAFSAKLFTLPCWITKLFVLSAIIFCICPECNVGLWAKLT